MSLLRSVLPVLLLLAGFAAAVVGVGQMTWWAPPPNLTTTISVNQLDEGRDAPLVVIDDGALGGLAEGATVSVKGPGKLVLAQGRADDVTAWVGKTASVTVTHIDPEKNGAETKYSDEGGPKADPRGSDLWFQEEQGTDELPYEWKAPDQLPWSLLIASDGSQAAASEISFTVPNTRGTPWAIPLVIVGVTLMLIGLSLRFLPKTTHVHRHRSRARKQVNVSVVLGVAAISSLVGIPSASAQISSGWAPGAGAPVEAGWNRHRPQQPTGETDVPVLSDKQLVRVLERVKETVSRADAAKDAALLEPRVGGQARQDRASNYAIRAAAPDYPPREPVANADLLSRMVSTDRAWPRTAITVIKSPENQVPQMLTLRQEQPRSNFSLMSTARLLPGQTLPQPMRSHVAPQSLDVADGGKMAPKDAIAAVAKALEDPGSVEGQALGKSPFIAKTKELQDKFRQEGKEADFTFKHEVTPGSTIAFPAANGGLIVGADLVFTVQARAKGENTVLSLTDPASKALAKEDKSAKGFDLTFNEHLTVVTQSPEDGPQLVAAERALVQSTLLKDN